MRTDLDGQVATVRSELLDFRAKAEENHLNLSTQLGFLVDYINRGGDAKKGEGGSSSRPQPPPDDQARPSGGRASREGGNSGGRGSESSNGSKRRRGSGGGSRDRQRSSGGGSGSGHVTYGPYLPSKGVLNIGSMEKKSVGFGMDIMCAAVYASVLLFLASTVLCLASCTLHSRTIHVELRSYLVVPCRNDLRIPGCLFGGREGYHGFIAGRGVDPAGSAPGGG
ncbi:hypothetical protein F511_34450 [Dorcoceras hygrometricum]|uniref:Uncharacterized protein n=1 Tax=Dorcoceras hygrometricum TaxID=472368 RepID=A0A2Z7DDZ2_9LAMI|nr:hypothetical protein F511_34450 [Dorcoceras hygrometricum]